MDVIDGHTYESENQGFKDRAMLFREDFEPHDYVDTIVGFCCNLYHDLTDASIPLIPGVRLQFKIELNTDRPEFLVLNNEELE